MNLRLSAPRARIRLCVVAAVAALITIQASQAIETVAQNGPVAVSVRMDPETPVIGDALHLEIEVIADPDIELLMPEFGEALERFKIVDFVPRERLDSNGQMRARQRYTLRVPSSGAHQIPSILVEFVDRRPGKPPAPDGQDAYEVLTDPIPFTVESVRKFARKSSKVPVTNKSESYGERRAYEW